MAASPNPKTLRIAVLLESVQPSDVMGIDILTNLSHKYVGDMANAIGPDFDKWKSYAMDVEVHYVSSALEPTCLDDNMIRFFPTTTYDDCPRDLDIVLIGGPWPNHRPEAAARFMREAWPRTRVFMTTCVGSLWLAHSVPLEGKKCTTNRSLAHLAKKLHPGVEWLDQRWVVEDKPFNGPGKGELWTSGGAGAGLDMIATFCLQNYGADFVRMAALEPLQMDPEESRTQVYNA